jgi:hypothetical protein
MKKNNPRYVACPGCRDVQTGFWIFPTENVLGLTASRKPLDVGPGHGISSLHYNISRTAYGWYEYKHFNEFDKWYSVSNVWYDLYMYMYTLNVIC